MPSTAETLLALLEHTDGDTLIVLLDGQNLLTLLRHAGRSDADVARALRVEKRPPGELLLELFREGRSAADMLATLGPDAIERAKRESEGRRAASATKPPLGPASLRGAVQGSRLWLVLVSIAGLAPALFGLLDLHVALKLLVLGPGPVLAGVGALGALGGAIGAKAPPGRALGAIAGALTAVGMFLGVYLYMVHGPGASRTSVLKLEIVLAAALGGVPGFALYFMRRRAGAGG